MSLSRHQQLFFYDRGTLGHVANPAREASRFKDDGYDQVVQ
jgi:hypothetical protein